MSRMLSKKFPKLGPWAHTPNEKKKKNENLRPVGGPIALLGGRVPRKAGWQAKVLLGDVANRLEVGVSGGTSPMGGGERVMKHPSRCTKNKRPSHFGKVQLTNSLGRRTVENESGRRREPHRKRCNLQVGFRRTEKSPHIK